MARNPHQLVTLSGTFGAVSTPVENWSYSLAFAPYEGFDVDTAPGYAESIADAWATTLGTVMKPSQHLTKVRIAKHVLGGNVGRTLDGGYTQGDWVGDKPGSSGGSALYPPQVCLVASLVTPRAGASGKGRIFLPAPPVGLDASYRIDATDAASVATKLASFINSCQAIVDGASIVSSTKGFDSPVIGIRVGRVLDTHRSRRTDMAEEYQSVDL